MTPFLTKCLRSLALRRRRLTIWSARRDVPRFEQLEQRLVPSLIVWTGEEDGSWRNAANWVNTASGAHVKPTSEDDVEVLEKDLKGNKVSEIVVDEDSTVNSVYSAPSGGNRDSFTITLNSMLNLNNGGTLGNGKLTINGPSNLEVNGGTLTWLSGTMAGNGVTEVNTGARLAFRGGAGGSSGQANQPKLDGRVLEIDGTMQMNNGLLILKNGAALNNTGKVEMSGKASIVVGEVGSATITNGNTFLLEDEAILDVRQSGSLTNTAVLGLYGSPQILSTQDQGGSVDNRGQVSVGAGRTAAIGHSIVSVFFKSTARIIQVSDANLEFQGNTFFTNTVICSRFPTNAQITYSEGLNSWDTGTKAGLDGVPGLTQGIPGVPAIVVSGTATLKIDDGLEITIPSVFTLKDGGEVNGAGTLWLTTLNWISGTMSGSGTTFLGKMGGDATAQARIGFAASPYPIILNGRVFVNNGSVQLSGTPGTPAFLQINGGGFFGNNKAFETLDDSSIGSEYVNGPTGRFVRFFRHSRAFDA
jgi:hypothetical protein